MTMPEIIAYGWCVLGWEKKPNKKGEMVDTKISGALIPADATVYKGQRVLLLNRFGTYQAVELGAVVKKRPADRGRGIKELAEWSMEKCSPAETAYLMANMGHDPDFVPPTE